jgi:photosystem II stability/assembly factor-like uncharacterized protein
MEGITIEKVICANSIYSNTINGSTNVTGSTPGPPGNPAVFNKNTLSIFSNFGVSLTNFGNNWVKSSAPQNSWQSVSLSASGQYQTAISNKNPGGDYIYISNDFGNTWIQKSEDVLGESLKKLWKSISLSASGQYQIAIYQKRQDGGSDILLPTYMYISTDFGNTWTQSQNADEKSWQSVSLSASGQHQTAVTQNDLIYVSNNFGNTWEPKLKDVSNTSLQKYWTSVSLSASGQYQTAVTSNDYIYVSTDFGNTWTQSQNSPQKFWQSVSLSASGQYQTAVGFNDYIYISTDFGNTWTQSQNSPQKYWSSVSLSASGQYQTSVANTYPGDYIYVSTDFGNTWTPSQNSPLKNWQTVSLSASGQYQTAVATMFGGEGIYTCISS